MEAIVAHSCFEMVLSVIENLFGEATDLRARVAENRAGTECGTKQELRFARVPSPSKRTRPSGIDCRRVHALGGSGPQ